jgi:excinuclease ABC subunit C
MTDELRLKISLLPEQPGVYRYRNSDGEIIYVGKAKNLKRRVSSYFNREHTVRRTAMLVRNIADMEYTVVNTEEEALDLENSLIKEFQPRYNVLLKDDKSYPWLCVTKELYPRVYITRDALHRGAFFFGPYPKAEVAHALLDVLRQIYPLRTCRLNVSRETIEARKHRLCLQYHIKNCEGCCQGLVTPEEYGRHIEQVKQILKGDTKQVMDYLMEQMTQLAAELKFEEANELKRKYRAIEQFRSRSVIVNPTIHNVDVLALVEDEGAAYVNYMHVRGGAVVQSLTLEYRTGGEAVEADSAAELMSLAVQEVRTRFAQQYGGDRVREVIVNVCPDVEFEQVSFLVPQRGDKRRLLGIALKNAEQYRTDKLKMMEKLNPEQRATRTLTAMQRDLHLTALPRHIECFDNSHVGGTNAVASCVVFKGAKPSKRDYRHFTIKEADGADDYASMREVITRRYTRLVAEGEPLPQLIVVDGGKGQLNAAVEALEAMGLRDDIAAVGIAKQLNELFFPGDSVPLYIDKNGETIRVIQRLRDEAHRFAITHHRAKRGKAQLHSDLDDIKGIGEKTKQLLLKHFKSVKRIREATADEIAAVVGPSRAKLIKENL